MINGTKYNECEKQSQNIFVGYILFRDGSHGDDPGLQRDFFEQNLLWPVLSISNAASVSGFHVFFDSLSTLLLTGIPSGFVLFLCPEFCKLLFC
jgi:hypothetical protein